MDIDRDALSDPAAEQPRYSAGTHGLSLPEPFILPCVPQVGNDEPVIQAFACIDEEHQLNERIAVHHTSHDNHISIESIGTEVMFPVRKPGKLYVNDGYI